MANINFQRTYSLDDAYQGVKERAFHALHNYLSYQDLFKFNDLEKSITFTSERLIPVTSSRRPLVMLLFSNPHPHSVYQGMFLSPNRRRRENLFWLTMREAGWITFSERNPDPRRLADIFLNSNFQGPFDLAFFCYYAFPTDLPDDIRKIFGKLYFKRMIEPAAREEFRQTVQTWPVKAVVTFNKEIYNLVSKDLVQRCLDRLMQGALIQSQITGIDRSIPVFLTFPTGWRYHKQYRQFRRSSLDSIRTAIYAESGKL